MKNDIKVNSKVFKKFLFIRARSNAYTKRLNQLRDELGLPEATGKIKGEHVLIDEDKKPIGKFTVSYRDSYEVKGGWVGRLS